MADLKCRRCGSRDVQVQAVHETRSKSGCMGCLIRTIFFFTSFVLWLLSLLFRTRKTTTRTVTYAVCQHCGHRWRV
ncbi:MAG: hypothetical protein LBM74_07055 [Oscillospiraceae bacterium]|jgi:hypothetical protein|nr:hypothetical protein [Oscillospiraceae bacterium]